MSENQNLTDRLPFKTFIQQFHEGIMVIGSGEVLYANNMLLDLFCTDDNISFPCGLNDLFNKNLVKLIEGLIDQFEQTTRQKKEITSSFTNELNIRLSAVNNEGNSLIILTFPKVTRQYSKKQTTLDHYSEMFPFVLIETDENGKILASNHQLEKQLLYNEFDIQSGLNLKDLLSPGNKPVIESLFNNFSEFQDNDNIEIRLKKKSGETLQFIMYFKAIIEKNKHKGLRCLLLDNSESKQIEYKYKQNQQRLRRVLDLVPHMIFLKDFNGNILLANKASANFYNTTTKKLVYSNISEFHRSKDELARILAEDKQVISAREKSEASTIEVSDLQENKHIFESTKVPFTDPVSGQVHSLGIFVDITEKKRVEEEIRDTKEKYRLLVERGSDGILILRDEQIVFANRQASKLFGQPINDFIGKPLQLFISREQLRKTIAEYSQNAQNKDIDNYYELKISKPDGEIAYAEAKINTINYEGKKSRLVFIRDITKRKIAENRSERDKNMLEQAQKIASLGSWEWDIQLSTFFCSDEIFQILEVTKNGLDYKSPKWLSKFIPLIDKTKVCNGFLNSLRSTDRYDIEFPVISINGLRKIIHSQSQVFKDKRGKIERVIGTWQDISERIRFEQILKEAKLKAEESDKLKSAFLANMSHEIRTPMNAILGFANLLKRQEIKSETRLEYIEHILQSGEGLLKLINDIVDISKIESNQLKIENGPLVLNEMLDQLYNRYEELLSLKNRNDLHLSLEKALPDPEFSVIADAFRLQQVISNLINNSIKFTFAGNIKFGYKIANSELQFFVEDQGVGIPADKSEIIFKRFGKLDDPGKMNKSGTGLGLSISKSLVDLMQGKIWLDSGEAGNTRFCFTIPLKFAKSDQNSASRANAPLVNENIDLRSKTILIAEDELLNYKLLETLLLKTGANVVWAKTGREAVEIATDMHVDLVFMDIKMPEMNGYEATKAIKKINRSIPIIAQTAFAFSNERKYILQSGCDMYLTKPINHSEIYKVLQKFLT